MYLHQAWRQWLGLELWVPRWLLVLVLVLETVTAPAPALVVATMMTLLMLLEESC